MTVQWRRRRGRHGITHAFEPGRRYSYCGKAERLAESGWLFSTARSSAVCLACWRNWKQPPNVTLAGLVY
jgi:hypothetical protein